MANQKWHWGASDVARHHNTALSCPAGNHCRSLAWVSNTAGSSKIRLFMQLLSELSILNCAGKGGKGLYWTFWPYQVSRKYYSWSGCISNRVNHGSLQSGNAPAGLRIMNLWHANYTNFEKISEHTLYTCWICTILHAITGLTNSGKSRECSERFKIYNFLKNSNFNIKIQII